MNTRAKIIKKIAGRCVSDLAAESLADEIIEDRKRICEPLVRFMSKRIRTDRNVMTDAIDESLKLAGLGEDE